MIEYIKYMIYVLPLSFLIAIGIELKLGPFLLALVLKCRYGLIITEPIINYFE